MSGDCLATTAASSSCKCVSRRATAREAGEHGGGRLNTRKLSRERADRFRVLHRREKLLVLPNAWDVPSARIFEEAGFPAVATSSATLAASVGYTDGEKIPKDELFSIVRKIAGALAVPLSVDIEGGYGRTIPALKDTIRRLVDAGAVGLNIEDTVRSEGRELRSVKDQTARLRAIREVSDAAGVPVVINARTDAYLVSPGEESARLEAAIRRGNLFGEAGADCLYPMGVGSPDAIRTYVASVNLPINVMVRKGLPPIRELERLGVRRLSLGPTSMYAALGALRKVATELLESGTYESLLSGPITYDDVMELAGPKSR